MWGHGGQFGYLLLDRGLLFVITADTQKDFEELDGDQFLEDYLLPILI